MGLPVIKLCNAKIGDKVRILVAPLCFTGAIGDKALYMVITLPMLKEGGQPLSHNVQKGAKTLHSELYTLALIDVQTGKMHTWPGMRTRCQIIADNSWRPLYAHPPQPGGTPTTPKPAPWDRPAGISRGEGVRTSFGYSTPQDARDETDRLTKLYSAIPSLWAQSATMGGNGVAFHQGDGARVALHGPEFLQGQGTIEGVPRTLKECVYAYLPQGERLPLTFSALRVANVARLPQFRNKHGHIAHSKPDGSDWSPAQWLQAVIGELGEYANFRKKFERGDITLEEFQVAGGKELADAVTYLDILATRCLDYDETTAIASWPRHIAHPTGIDLGKAVQDKWNEVSRRVGSDVRLDTSVAYRLLDPANPLAKSADYAGTPLFELSMRGVDQNKDGRVLWRMEHRHGNEPEVTIGPFTQVKPPRIVGDVDRPGDFFQVGRFNRV